ncbi:UNKNOWN [Stylonychia lemnae]|uniref:Transmembrane protein n=1 Tax=Stylonychia lemnae TaxID=5949 RepID=A0A077ZMQ1_STYLE|nr:UNKNOWN [Stylonychia lemnae]|eukprot:CDW71213.1 UNKNOWN [Stylonychia lemnae]
MKWVNISIPLIKIELCRNLLLHQLKAYRSNHPLQEQATMYDPNLYEQQQYSHGYYQEGQYNMNAFQNQNYGIEGNYPKEVPPEVQVEIMKQQEEDKKKKAKLCLNFLPGFKGKTNKQQFIIKVYSLLFIMLGITFGFVLITMLTPIPLNYICLFLYTIFTTYFVAAICAFIDAQIVLIAAILTMTIFFALTFLTFFMISSNKKYGLTYDDYVIGALLLYSVIYKYQKFIDCQDVITLFLWVIAILGASKSASSS